MSEEVTTKGNKGKRFLLGLLYWVLLVIAGVLPLVTESVVPGLIMSAILLIVFLIWPKRKGLWFWWWVILAALFTAWYAYCMTKGGA